MDSLLPASHPTRPLDKLTHPAVLPSASSQGSRYGFDGSDTSDTSGGILDYWRMVKRHRTTVIVASLIGLMAGFGASIPVKPVYRARTSLEVLNLNEDFMNMRQSSPVTANDNSYDASEAQTQTKLLESDSLLSRVFDKLNPGGQPTSRKAKAASSGWRAWLHLPEPVQLTPREKLLEKAASSLKVRATPRTRVIEATVESTDPQLAAQFANTLIQEYIQQNLEARFAATHRTSDWLSREIDDARTALKRSEADLQAYARHSGLIFTEDNNNVATEKLQQLQQQLSLATAERISKQARFELAKNSPPDSVADVLNDAGLKDTGSKLNDLRRQLADLSAIYNPEYGKIKRTQAEVAVLEGAFQRTRADILQRIENDYREATNREALLATAYDEQTREVSGQDEKAIQYNILKREVDSNRQLYDTMLQQTKQSSLASALRASNVRVVDPADVPDRPFSPNFKMNSALGFLGGLFLSVIVVTVRERADRTLQQPGDIKLWTDLTELGAIPNGSTDKKLYARSSVQSSLKGPAVPQAVELITSQQKFTFTAEGFRSTLTSILFASENGVPARVLVFTSSSASEGKTTVVSNLAIATAEIRRKVLVIDADLRRPRMHVVFDVPNNRGLSDLLREELSEENATGLVHETRIPNLHVLPAGPSTYAAAHLLYSRNLAPLLEKFRNEYDMILIDTPPMLQMTDARVAGRLADAVILVARSGQTTRDALLAAKERLSDDSIRILGTILNDWNPDKAPGGYYGQYRDGSYGKNQARYAETTA
jgi:polysaccharide biosynthesis transport protein